MTPYSVIPMEAKHLKEFIPQDAQNKNFLDGVDWDYYWNRGFALTSMWIDRPIAISGIIEQYPGVGEAWTILSKSVSHREMIYIFRCFESVIEAELKVKYHRIYCHVDFAFNEGARMARMLRMKDEGILKGFPEEGKTSILFARTR